MPTLFTYLIILLGAGFIGGVLLKSFKQPPVVGYLLTGLVLGLTVGTTLGHESIAFLSEMGVVLLLFGLGLEFSLVKLKRFGKIAVVGGLLQIGFTWLLAGLLIHQFGFSPFASVFMAAAFSLSSTAVVVKLLTDKGEMDSLAGEIMVAWLIVQDLAVLPMLILLPAIGNGLASGARWYSVLPTIGAQLAISFGLILLIIVLGKQVVPWFVDKIAALQSRELLLIGVFLVAMVGALTTQTLGLSAALGAFLAGMLIADSVEQHAIFSELRPLRDLFSLLFFVTLGLIIPPGFIFEHFGSIVLLAALIMLVKFVVVSAIMFLFGYHAKTSFILGVGLIEVGEFAFILGKTGLSANIIDTTTYGMILSVALISILLMPPLFFATPQLYATLRDLSKKRFTPIYTRFFRRLEHKDTLPELPFENHVVLCGYGRVGKYVGRALSMADIPYVVIEYNHHTAQKLKKENIEVVYGDPSDVDILDLAQVDKAKAIVIAIPDITTQQAVIVHSLTLNKNITIYCRTHHEDHQQVLKALGVTSIIQPEFEASLSITDKILKIFGKEPAEIEGKISRLKIEHGLG